MNLKVQITDLKSKVQRQKKNINDTREVSIT